MIDINNNPPRFFNEDTQKLIADDSEAFLYCETCQDTNFGEIVEGKVRECSILISSIILLNFLKGSLDTTTETTMFIRLEDTQKDSGIPIIVYDMDDNGNSGRNAEFTVSISEIKFKKEDINGVTQEVNPCADSSCGLCENGVPKKIFSFNNEDQNGNLKANKQWANTFLEFNNIVQFRN